MSARPRREVVADQLVTVCDRIRQVMPHTSILTQTDVALVREAAGMLRSPRPKPSPLAKAPRAKAPRAKATSRIPTRWLVLGMSLMQDWSLFDAYSRRDGRRIDKLLDGGHPVPVILSMRPEGYLALAMVTRRTGRVGAPYAIACIDNLPPRILDPAYRLAVKPQLGRTLWVEHPNIPPRNLSGFWRRFRKLTAAKRST